MQGSRALIRLRQQQKLRREQHETTEALHRTYRALQANEKAFQMAQDRFVIEQLIYEHAALECRCRALLRELRGGRR